MAEMSEWPALLTGGFTGLVLGGIFGGVIERTVFRPIDRLGKYGGRRWARWQSNRRRGRLGIDGGFLVAGGGERVFVHQFSPQGFGLSTAVVDVGSIETQLARLPQELRPVDVKEATSIIAARRAELEADPGAWNEEKFGVADVYVSRDPADDAPQLTINFHKTDFAAYSAIGSAWSARAGQGALDRLGAEQLRDVLPGLGHSFGVNATVVTADDRLLLTRRSSRTYSGRARNHISVNEGMRADDVTGNRADPVSALERGIAEELGIDMPKGRVVFHSLILDVERYEWGFLGHVNLRGTKWTAARVHAARAVGSAVDSWESDELRDVAFTARQIAEELRSPDDWIAHGWANLLLSGVYAFPHAQERFLEVISRSRGADARGRNASRRA